MQNTLEAVVAAVLAARAALAQAPVFGIPLQHLASIGTASDGSTGAEIVAYDARTRRAFAINSNGKPLLIVGNEVSRTVAIFQVNRTDR